MKPVILLNPNQQLFLRNEELKILSKINRKFQFFLQIFPQLIFIESENLKNFSEEDFKKKIKSIQIENIEFIENSLYFRVKIETKTEKIYEKIKFAENNSKININPEEINFTFDEFSLNIKSFKIGQIKENSFTNSYEIFDEKWIKLK